MKNIAIRIVKRYGLDKKFKRDMQRVRSHWREGSNGPFCSLSCSTTNRWTKEFVKKNKPYKIMMLKKRRGT